MTTSTMRLIAINKPMEKDIPFIEPPIIIVEANGQLQQLNVGKGINFLPKVLKSCLFSITLAP